MTDSVTACCGGGLLAGEQEQKILQLVVMNHSLKRLNDEKDAEIAALREFVRWHFMHHSQSWPGNAEIMPAVHRALGETP